MHVLLHFILAYSHHLLTYLPYETETLTETWRVVKPRTGREWNFMRRNTPLATRVKRDVDLPTVYAFYRVR